MDQVDVLYAEDDDDHAELVEEALSECSAHTRLYRVNNGEDALQFLKHQGEYQDAPRPALVLLDINMPRMNGLEVLEQIKQDRDLKDLPVVMLSSSDSDTDKRSAVERCANSYLVKPVDFNDMIDMFNSLLGYWSTWHRRPQA